MSPIGRHFSDMARQPDDVRSRGAKQDNPPQGRDFRF
jgi:hypothetical protein